MNIIRYQRQSPILNLTILIDHGQVNVSFLCNSFVPTEHISIQQGDIIGICLPGTNSLDIVSDTSDGSYRLLYYNKRGISDCSNTEFRETIDDRQTSFQGNRIAHLYAEITSKIF